MACENCSRPALSASSNEGSAEPAWPQANPDCPSCLAKQSQGNERYSGVDAWANTVIPKGEVLYYLGPTSSGFFTTVGAVTEAGLDAETLHTRLQIAPHRRAEQRPLMAVEVPTDIVAAAGLAQANPQYGNGGCAQFYIPGFSGTLIPPQQKRIA